VHVANAYRQSSSSSSTVVVARGFDDDAIVSTDARLSAVSLMDRHAAFTRRRCATDA
jgi:hypothetical protein